MSAWKLSALCGAEIWIKSENLQVTNSFKERAALVKLANFKANHRKVVIADTPAGLRALQLPDTRAFSYFLETFGRPDRVKTCECERTAEPSMSQALHIANGDTVNKKLSAKDSIVTRLLDATLSDEKLIDEASLASLSRLPSSSEKERFLNALAGTKDADDQLAETLTTLRDQCRRLRPGTIVIVFDAANMRHIAQIAAAFSALPVRIHLLPTGLGGLMQRSRVAHCGRVRVLELFSRPCSLVDRMVKRGFDLALAICGAVALAPVFVLIAIAIKLDTRGPVFFVQTRHGFNEEPIRVIKFRTMTTTEDGPDFRQATRGDTRVTRVGRLLRRTSLDELPQLFNVIAGTMSIVGPRPHAVAHNRMFSHQIALMSRRHNVRPGITGWAQVHGYRGETDTSEKMRKRVELDLYYIDNWSIILDIKIVLMTLFSRRAFLNAY